MANWNGMPIPNPPTPNIPNSIPANFNWNSYLSDPKGTFNKFKGAREVHRMNWRGYKTASGNIKKVIASSPSRKMISAAAKRIKILKGVTKESKNLWDIFLKKAPGDTPTKKAANAGGVLGPLISIAVTVGVAAFILKLNELVQAANELSQDRSLRDAFKTLGTIQLVQSRLNTTNEKVEKIRLQDQRTRDRIYALEKQSTLLRESANDTLYEVRQGRKIVESKIDANKKLTNDTLYETRQGRRILEDKILEAKKLGNDALYETRQGREKIQAQIDAIKSQVLDYKDTVVKNFQTKLAELTTSVSESLKKTEVLKNKSDSLEKKVDALPPTIISIQKDIAKINPSEIVGTAIKYVDGKIAEIRDILRKDIQPKVEAQGKELDKVGKVTVTTYDGVTKSLRDTYNLSFEAGAAKWNEDIRAAQSEAQKTTSATISSNFTTSNAQTTQQIDKLRTEIKTDLTQQDKELERLKTDLEKTKQGLPSPSEINNLKIQTGKLNQKIPQLEKDIQQQKKVNDEAIPKLDDILGKLGFIPALTANSIRPDIPTLPQIEQATGTAMCKSLNGGCSGKALNNQTSNIKDAVNQANNDLLDKINTGANAAQLTLLGTINNKLGEQLPGGISGKLERFAKWMHLDRALNILIWWQTLHNAYMLSANLGQTLTSAISNVLAAIGIKDAEGSPLDIGEILGNQFDALAKSVLGESEWGSIKAEYKKWNRIYQATANLLNSIQSIGYSILSALEVVGSWVALIGNALRKWGEVGERAYQWMNPTPNFQNKFFTTLENVENVVSQVDQVASEVLSVQDTVKQIGVQKTEFEKALKEDDDGKQGKLAPEAAKVKAAADLSKSVSATGLAISDNDKEADD